MSIRSLLQLILFLLIIIIIGSIYFFYFFKIPDNQKILMDNILIEKVDNTTETDRELLENSNLEDNDVITQSDKNLKNLDSEKVKLDSNKSIKNFDDNKNITKDIEYITTNDKGEIFKILAKYGKTNIDNSSVLDLQEVNGEILSDIRSNIYLSSDFANYNYNNQNSKFYDNVTIKYDGKIITCDKLDLIINENIAIAYSNVVVKDNSSIMKAQIITLDIITKDIKINSDDKINIIKKNN